jgi:hypothetical protein
MQVLLAMEVRLPESAIGDGASLARPCPECGATAVAGFDRCLADLPVEHQMSALAQMTRSRQFELPGTRLDAGAIARLVDALVGCRGRLIVDGAVFDGPVDLSLPLELESVEARKATFTSTVDATGLLVHGLADFSGAEFQRRALFGRDSQGEKASTSACFRGPAVFRDMVARDEISFRRVRFLATGQFKRAICERRASWSEALFLGTAGFQDGVYNGIFSMRAATVVGNVTFHNSVFDDQVWCTGLSCFRPADPERMREVLGATGTREPSDEQLGRISFREARLAGATVLGALRAEQVVLAQARFGRKASVTALTNHLLLGDVERESPGAEFNDGAALVILPNRCTADDQILVAEEADSIGGAELREETPTIDMTGTSFVSHCALSSGRRFPTEFFRERLIYAHGSDPAYEGQSQRLADEQYEPTRRARVASVRRADLSGLAVSRVDFSDSLVAGVINLDELRLSSDVGFGTGSGRFGLDPELDHHQRAEFYRSLRRATEGRGDAAGADRFYVFEMSERRKASRRRDTWSDWVIITMYDLVSGFGLRGLRSLLWLTAFILLAGWGLAVSGHQSYVDGLVVASQSAVSLSPGADSPDLGSGGEFLRVIMRLAGPLFIGLALLAIRARVKR